MRIILTILFFIPVFANATTYYVANGGSDSNNGLTTGTPFATIGKAISVAVKKDSIRLNRGDSWSESFTIPCDSLYIGAYGSGVNPLITGFTTLTGMTNVGNVWSATAASSVKSQRIVTINGNIGYKARTPNTGYLTATSVISTTQIKIPHTATSYVGDEIAIKPQIYIIDASKILTQKTGASFDTLVLATAISGGSGTSYFIQNGSLFIDTTNEWSCDSTSKLISVYATSSPAVQYSSKDTLVNCHKHNNIVFDSIKFSGANMIAIATDSVRSDTIKNCSFINNYDNIFLLSCRYCGIISNDINYSLNCGYQSYTDTALSIRNNTINHSGYYAGMGGNGALSYMGGINHYGNYAYIYGNYVTNSGYHGIRFGGQFDTIYHNRVDTFCLLKDDGGGIYTFNGLGNDVKDSGSLVKENIVSHAPTGTECHGIYLDDYVDDVTAYGNTVFNCIYADIQFKGFNNTIVYNTTYDIIAASVNAIGKTYISKHNIFFNYNPSSHTFVQFGAKDSIETIDSNYYMMPISPETQLVANTVAYSLLGWQTYYPTYDIHSVASLRYGVTSNTPTLFINPTLHDSTVTISGGYYDAAGNGYAIPSFVLPAFQSRLLWPAIYNPPTFGYRINIKTQ